MYQYFEKIQCLVSSVIKIRIYNPPPIVLCLIFGVIVLLIQVLMFFDIEARLGRMKPKRARKNAGQKTEPKQLAICPADQDQPKQPMTDAVKTGKSMSKLALERAIQTLAMKTKMDYILSVEPCQFLRDEEGQLLDSKFKEALEKTLTNSESLCEFTKWDNIPTDDASNDESDNNPSNSTIELTDEERKKLINSLPSIWSIGSAGIEDSRKE